MNNCVAIRYEIQIHNTKKAVFNIRVVKAKKRDGKFTESFRSLLRSVGIKPLKLPKQSPNWNAFAERFVLSIKSECLSKLIFFSEESLKYALKER